MDVERVVREVDGEYIVARTRHGDRACATRIWIQPARIDLDDAMRAACTTGATVELPTPIAETLGGFRVRATLGAIAGVADIVAAGVTRVRASGLAPTALAYGYAYVSTAWIDGPPAGGPAIAADVARVVRALHDRGVAHGALAPSSFVAIGDTAWLIDVAGLRAIAGDDDPRIAADLAVIDAIAAAPPPPPPPAPPVIDPSSTVHVPDGTLFRDRTIAVADDPPPPPPPRRGWWAWLRRLFRR